MDQDVRHRNPGWKGLAVSLVFPNIFHQIGANGAGALPLGCSPIAGCIPSHHTLHVLAFIHTLRVDLGVFLYLIRVASRWLGANFRDNVLQEEFPLHEFLVDQATAA